jgi:hypothetical protein
VIENPAMVSPLYGVDKKGRYRTWPTFAGVDPDDLIDAPWEQPVTDAPLPVLVLPGPLHEPTQAGA